MYDTMNQCNNFHTPNVFIPALFEEKAGIM